MSEEQRRQLQQQLWNIANTLRGKMGADEFRDYILGFIFYKYLSEKIQRYADSMLEEDGLKFASLDESSEEGAEYIEAVKDATVKELGYFLKPSELFHAIALKGNNQADTHAQGEGHNFILGDLTRILKNIEQSTLGTDSADDFNNLFEDLDLTSSKLGNSEKAKNELVTKVLIHLDQIDFNLSDATADVLGDAYEYLIGEFASGAGKKAGEFYTPQPVSILLAKLVTSQNKNLKNVYDPTCGSGSLLLRVKREAAQDYKIKIYGQELNRTTYNLARMNMILHDVHYADFDIRQENTLEHPQHRELRFDAIVANPPFSAHWGANPLFMSDDRFSVYGRLAPGTKADMAFVQHMVYQLADDGIMACVLPHGVLFRGAAEGHIRQYLIEQLNCLDAVIGLPEKIFYGTTIPTCVLVFKKCRKNPDDILFIDASQHFEKVKTQNKLLPEHIDKIVTAYTSRCNESKYSHVASLAEIKANDYNLNIPRFIDTFEAKDAINLNFVTENLKLLDEKSKEADEVIFSFCSELNLPVPKGNNVFWLAQYKQGVMQQIFSQKLRFKDDKGLNFPEWEEKQLKDLVLSPITYGVVKPGEHDINGVKLIRGGDILQGKIINNLRTISKEISSQYQRTILQGGELLVSLVGNPGEVALVTDDLIGANLARQVGLVRLTKDINSHFALYYLMFTTEAITSKVTGSVQQVINLEDLQKVKIKYPLLAEQVKIANFLTALDEKISYIQTQLDAVKLYRQSML